MENVNNILNVDYEEKVNTEYTIHIHPNKTENINTVIASHNNNDKNITKHDDNQHGRTITLFLKF